LLTGLTTSARSSFTLALVLEVRYYEKVKAEKLGKEAEEEEGEEETSTLKEEEETLKIEAELE